MATASEAVLLALPLLGLLIRRDIVLRFGDGMGGEKTRRVGVRGTAKQVGARAAWRPLSSGWALLVVDAPRAAMRVPEQRAHNARAERCRVGMRPDHPLRLIGRGRGHAP